MARKILGLMVALAVLASTFGAALPVKATAPPIISGWTYDMANLARGMVVTSTSGSFQGNPTMVTDNDPLTTWYAATTIPNQLMLDIDLIEKPTLGYIAVTFVNAKSVKVYVREDETWDWILVGTKSWAGPVDGPVIFPMNGNYPDKQFIRVELTTTSASPIGVSEVEAYGWVEYIPPSGVIGTTNIALNKPITSYEGTALPGYEASKANDGDFNSEFRLTAGDANNSLWGNLRVDLGTQYPIGRVTLDPRNTHWYRVILRSTATDQFEKRVLNAYPDYYGTSTSSSAQDEFLFDGSKPTRYIYLWTQLDRPPQAIESAVRELQVFTMDAPTAAEISVNRPGFDFDILQGTSPPSQNLVIFNSGGSVLQYSITSTQSWLVLSKAGANLPKGEADTVVFTINSNSLAPGNYTAGVIISDPNASNSPVEVAVNLKVGVPTVSVVPTNLSFNTDLGVNPAAKTVTVTNSGVGTLDFSVASSQAWLTAAPQSGTVEVDEVGVPVTVTANTAAMASGTYNANLTLTNNFNGLVTTVPVVVTVNQPPSITLTTAASLGLGALPGGSAYGTVKFRNGGGGILNWSASSNALWLSASPASGSLRSIDPDAAVNITASSAGLAPGTYNGLVTIAASNAGVASKTVAVTFSISQLPSISVSSAAFSFSGTTDNASLQNAALTVTNSGGGVLAFSVAVEPAGSWLSVSPTIGSASAGQAIPLTVSVNPSGLAAGVFNGTLVITASGASNSPVRIPVSLTLSVKPAISLSVTNITLNTTPGINPPAQTLVISNTGGGILTWAARSNVAWMTVSPSSGNSASGPSNVTLAPSTSSFGPGTYTGRITVESIGASGASNSPRFCDVTVVISLPPTVSVVPATIDLTAATGATTPASQLVSLTSTSPLTSNWTATSSAAWLTVSPATGSLSTGSSSFTVNASAAALAAGVYTASVNLNLPGAAVNQVTVPVSLTVTTVTPPPPPPGGDARGYKQDAVLAIQQVASQKHSVDNNIDKAVDYIQQSLKPALWLNANHLVVKDGEKVFKYEAKAAVHLMELVKQNKVPPAVSAAAKISLNDLVQADKVLARTAYDEALPLVTSQRGQLRLQTAFELMERAAAELLSKKVNYAQVIDRYGKAWRYIQYALKAQDPPPPPPPAGDTARALKTTTMNALAAIQTGDKQVDKNLESAVKNIGESLNPKYWIDGDYLNPKKGNKVFDNERQAAHDLMQVMDDKDAPTAIKMIAKLSAENLVAADKALAGDAFKAAGRYAGDKKVDKELAQAAGYIVKARIEMGKAKPDYRDAIQDYNKAWENAQQAIKYGTGHDKDKGDDDHDCDREWLKSHGADRDRDKDRAGVKYWN